MIRRYHRRAPGPTVSRPALGLDPRHRRSEGRRHAAARRPPRPRHARARRGAAARRRGGDRRRRRRPAHLTPAAPIGWLAAAGALVGAIVGSYVAVLVLRWPAARATDGRSACDACGAALRWWELAPVVSHVALHGRCRRCGAPIDRLHLGCELAGAGIGAAACGLGQPAGALLGWALLALALLDLRHYWLPDRLTLPLAAIGLACGMATPVDRLAAAAAGFAALALVAAAYRRLRGRVGLGAGDAKLFAAIGTWLGWRPLPAVLLAACLLGLAAALALRLERAARLPFGTLLAAAAWGGWLWLQRSGGA